LRRASGTVSGEGTVPTLIASALGANVIILLIVLLARIGDYVCVYYLQYKHVCNHLWVNK
jgi:hypothetical protein